MRFLKDNKVTIQRVSLIAIIGVSCLFFWSMQADVFVVALSSFVMLIVTFVLMASTP